MNNIASQSLKNPSIQQKTPQNSPQWEKSGISGLHETTETEASIHTFIKDGPETEVLFDNGITPEPRDPTVNHESGINRNPPYSGINTGSRDSRDKKVKIGRCRKCTSLETVRFRERPVLHTHRLDAIVKLDTLDMEKAVNEITQVLGFREYMRRDIEKEKFKTIVVKEKRGESVVVSYGKVEKVYIIHLTTHDLDRLERFRGYVREILRLEFYMLLLEVYVRYHEIDELKVELAIRAVKQELGEGDPLNLRQMPYYGTWDNYLVRGNILYKDARVVIKSYRHKSYRRYKTTEAEYHPKLEELIIVEKASTTTPVLEVLREYTPLLYTIAYTENIHVIEGDYEKNHTTVLESEIDPYVKRLIKGIKSKYKAEILLERQYPDKRLAIAQMLDRGKKIKDIARDLGYSVRWVIELVKEMVNQGILIRVKKGKYKLNPKYTAKKEEKRYKEHGGDFKEFLGLIEHNKDKVVNYNLNGTPYVEIREETPHGIITTRYIFNRIEVRERDVKLRDGRTYLITRRELEALIKRILETGPPHHS